MTLVKKKNRIAIIGVTGGFGTGKSTVAGFFKGLGAKILNADKIAHEALEKNTFSYRKVVKEFGKGILTAGGKIDRAKLANVVFYNKKRLKKLCGIIHPIVLRKIRNSVKTISRSKDIAAVAIDAPLLIEAGLHKITDYLIVVKTSQNTQLRRAMKKTGLSFNEVTRRIKSQMPLKRKVKMADYVIDNEGSKINTRKTVKKIWEGIKSGRE